MTSTSRASSEGKPASISGAEWDELSSAGKIRWLLDNGDSKWGWVIYRCTYKPELDGNWENFKRLIKGQDIREDIVEKMDWAFVEDPALEGASLEELKQRFRAWARAENPNYDIDNIFCSRGSRYTFFIQVNEDALRDLPGGSIATSGLAARKTLDEVFVNIVHAWIDGPPPGEEIDEFGDPVDCEDWMMIPASMIAPYFYIDLDNDEVWYVHYRPQHGLCVW